MPSAADILRGLTLIANDFVLLAVGWHAALAVALVAIFGERWKPSHRNVAVATALPLASVSALAWAHGNPFNGTTFALLSVGVGFVAMRSAPREPIAQGARWPVALGVVTLAYAWAYPHFLESYPAWTYLIAAPVGLVPCPTLGALLGLGLVTGGFRSLAWSVVVSIAGLLYALFGMLRLGVWLDAGLLAASVAMLVAALAPRLRRGSRRETAAAW